MMTTKQTYLAPETSTFLLPEREIMELALAGTGDHASAPERIMIEPD